MSGAQKLQACRNIIRRRRSKKKSVLFYGEGPTEEAFLNYIHSIYFSRNLDKAIQRGSSMGGSHVDIIYHALTYKLHTAEFDKIYVLLDEDEKTEECSSSTSKAKAKIRGNTERKRTNVKCIYSSPQCIEGFFLSLLEGQAPALSAICKTAFHSRYLGSKEKLRPEMYGKIFPKDYLDIARLTHPLLDEIINVFESSN